MTKQYALGGYAGKIWRGKNPFSGAEVSVYHSEQAGMDHTGGTKYHAVCEDHGTMMAETSIKGAKSAAIDSPSWCEECADAMNKNPNLGKQFN